MLPCLERAILQAVILAAAKRGHLCPKAMWHPHRTSKLRCQLWQGSCLQSPNTAHRQRFPQHPETVFSSHRSSTKASALPGEEDVAVLSSPAVYDRELLDFVSGAQRVVDSIFLLQKNRGENKKKAWRKTPEKTFSTLSTYQRDTQRAPINQECHHGLRVKPTACN